MLSAAERAEFVTEIAAQQGARIGTRHVATMSRVIAASLCKPLKQGENVCGVMQHGNLMQSLKKTFENIGDPGRIRTCNPRSRNPLLYPVELRDRFGVLIPPI